MRLVDVLLLIYNFIFERRGLFFNTLLLNEGLRHSFSRCFDSEWRVPNKHISLSGIGVL